MNIGRLVRQSMQGALLLALVVALAQASSHREAPSITHYPKVDATDFLPF